MRCACGAGQRGGAGRCVIFSSDDDVFDGHGWPAAESEKSMDGSQASEPS